MATLPSVSINVVRPSQAGPNGYIVFGDPTYGKFDGTRKFAPRMPYTDEGAYFRSMRIQRGSSNASDVMFHPATGTATVVLDNRGRTFDPNSATDIRPQLGVNVEATWNAITYDLFTGFATSWTLDYPTQSSTGDAVVTLGATDGQDLFADLNVKDILPSQLTGARINAYADAIGWEAGRVISAGQTVMPISTQTESGWSAVVEAADSDMGEVYVDCTGQLTFRDRNTIVSDARTVASQATFGDTGAELLFSDVVVSYDDTLIRNDIQVTYNEAGAVAYASDPPSIFRYGRRSFQVNVQCATSSVAQNLAGYLLLFYKNPLVRVAQITVQPQRDPTNLFPQVLERELGDRITVKFTPPGGGSRIVRDCLIRGISHDVTPSSWKTTFTLQDATPFGGGTYIKFDGTSAFDGTKSFWF